ncbi:hypothetical protein FZEAL_9373 [Fusarium zealandicum]|uniref:Uncharacterized protein n=1 Tax=Fusarium zealandicum TaxID=1053134 RepID=A0A8H4UBN7_9HYPO|nr:hypothetical protein FZEAL_9373 [Fusarium zealandicum]
MEPVDKANETKPVRRSRKPAASFAPPGPVLSRTTTSRSKPPRRPDRILAMNDPYMQQIIDGTKTYEFRRYNMAGIDRIWFCRTALHSAITHICPVNEAATRSPGDEPLP